MRDGPPVHDIEKMAISMRKMLEPSLPQKNGTLVIAGSCLYASFLLQRALEQFADCVVSVQGGDGKGDGGILGCDGNWHGHYWVEGRTFTGKTFVADITADQFGYDPVVVTPHAGTRTIPTGLTRRYSGRR